MNYKKLPVYRQKSKILDKLKKHSVIVVESPTGSGKTTQIPQILIEAGYAEKGMIGVTQPRRIAAVSVAQFIAAQQGTAIPDVVGYKMRFEDRTSQRTKIKIMTDGILLQEIKLDYDLKDYSVIIVDEAHERSLNIDFIIGLLKRAIKKRPDFKVIISSATINADVFSQYFDNCPIVYIDTVIYPIDVYYTPLKEEQKETLDMKVAGTVTEICSKSTKGDILIFLSGVQEIKAAITKLEESEYFNKLEILPLYSRLSTEEQERVFLKYPGKRKVIIATNIAETSVTIDGVEFVIDSGLAKMNHYNPWTFTSSLIEMSISKAACNQRKGRAGRTRPGKCYRLYKHSDYEKRDLYTLEEIYRTDLSEVIMRMAEIGITDFENFDFLSSPGINNIKSAIRTLEMLDALDETRNLTNIGLMMARFPLLPRHSRIIVEGIMRYPDVIDEVLIATSFLTTNSPFLLPQGEEMEARKAHHFFRDENGDFISYIKILDAFEKASNREAFCSKYYLDYKGMLEIQNIKVQLSEIVTEMDFPIQSGGPLKNYLCAVSRGLIQFVCINTGKGNYKSLTANNIMIHPGSVMFRESPQFIVAGEIVKTTKMYARSVSELKYNWLADISPFLAELTGFAKGSRAKSKDKDKKQEPRDFTNQIKIGKEIFKIKQIKGKRKLVVIPWEKIKPVMDTFDKSELINFKGLHGTILYKGMELLPNTNLSLLLEIASKIPDNREILYNWPADKYHFKQGTVPIIHHIDSLMNLCKKHKRSRKLGFLSLDLDSEGFYQLRFHKNFYQALSGSIASLEAMADEPVEFLPDEDREKINKMYRYLSSLLEVQ